MLDHAPASVDRAATVQASVTIQCCPRGCDGGGGWGLPHWRDCGRRGKRRNRSFQFTGHFPSPVGCTDRARLVGQWLSQETQLSPEYTTHLLRVAGHTQVRNLSSDVVRSELCKVQATWMAITPAVLTSLGQNAVHTISHEFFIATPFCRQSSQGSERGSHLPGVTQQLKVQLGTECGFPDFQPLQDLTSSVSWSETTK